MGFTQGAKITSDIVDEIVNGLINSEVWHNVDTTWNSTVKTQNSSRHILTYGAAGGIGKGDTILSATVAIGDNTISVIDSTNFNVGNKVILGDSYTGEVRDITIVDVGSITVSAGFNTAHAIDEPVREIDFEIFMAIEVINQTPSGQNYYFVGWPTNNWYYGKGIRITFSQSWDYTAHTYPTSNQSSFIGFESCQYCGVSADLATLMVTYYLWVDSTGFVIMGKPEPTGDNQQQSFITVVERNPSKEYADGYTNFFCYTAGNIWQQLYDGNNIGSIYRSRSILRPFAFQWPDGGGQTTAGANGNGISFVPLPSYYAFRSGVVGTTGNNKVYYVKPMLHNMVGQIAPIFQSDLFFLWSEGVGLIDGDVVSIDGRTTKYLCKALDSTDSINRLTYAIKYVE